jgi:primosomal protein N' (replication factor Y)
MIQTFRPGNEAIRCAREGRLEDFYRGELEVRKSIGFPPYGRMIRFVFRGKDRKAVTSVSRSLAASCGEAADGHFTMLGPSECPLSVLSGNYRRHLIVLTRQFGKTHSIIAKILSQFKVSSRVYLEVDVDPVSLL